MWALCGSMWTHCGRLMSQSGNFLHSVDTMWIYVNTLWWINATEWQFASKCGHYVALFEHTVVNSVHCCDYVNTVWISLSHSEGANSYSVDMFTLWQLYVSTTMIHIVSITIQCRVCPHSGHNVVTLCSYSWLCVNCMNTISKINRSQHKFEMFTFFILI